VGDIIKLVSKYRETNLKVLTGLDILIDQEFSYLRGKSIGILCNQATIDQKYRHILQLLLPLHQNGFLKIQSVLGPQHGLWGHTQDNMIEWEGYQDPNTDLTIYSLYGKHRKPTDAMLSGLDIMLVDLPDIGSRYYTFIWTMALTMEACAEKKIPLIVLDRPNPINGEISEGTILEDEYRSFVGLYPLVQRHGMTIGEIATYIQQETLPNLKQQIILMKGWSRNLFFPETELPWAMPSPNIPGWETALVYPGMCLLEGTNLSEGRGTTRPFELFGAPWIDGRKLCEWLNSLDLPGVLFRPVQFLPTFQKHRDKICEGGFIHITDRQVFSPVLTGIALLMEILTRYQQHFRWNDPPYEYEYQKKPIDILFGNGWLRPMMEERKSLSEIRQRMESECREFEAIRRNYFLYE
jgi:uncharacterized protein YbbC (DUF1343 family)